MPYLSIGCPRSIRRLLFLADHHSRQRRLNVRNASSIPNDQPRQAVLRDETKPSVQPKVKIRKTTPELWVRPGSLKETLYAHQEANRNGLAVDGVLQRPARPIKHRGRLAKAKSRREKTAPGDGMLTGARNKGFKRLQLYRNGHFDSSDYSGRAPPILASWKASAVTLPSLRTPWILPFGKAVDASFNVPATQRLSDEVRLCGAYLTPDFLEKSAANAAYEDIKAILSSVWPGISLKAIGSRANNTATPFSDIDLIVAPPDDWDVSDTNFHNFFIELVKRLKKRENYASQQQFKLISAQTFIRGSKAWLIEFRHQPSELSVQLQPSTDSFDSLLLVKALRSEFPTIDILYRVIKQMLVMRGLNIGSHGGLTSYPLINMIAASLRLGTAARDRSAIGPQLLEFLEFYANIDFYSQGIFHCPSVEVASHFCVALKNIETQNLPTSYDPFTVQPRIHKLVKRDGSTAALMCLQDPIEPLNNLGRNIRLIKHIQAVFAQAERSLRDNMEVWDRKYIARHNLRLFGPVLLDECVGGDYAIFEESRLALRAYARNHSSDVE